MTTDEASYRRLPGSAGLWPANPPETTASRLTAPNYTPASDGTDFAFGFNQPSRTISSAF
jgi:hypothetical protein